MSGQGIPTWMRCIALPGRREKEMVEVNQDTTVVIGAGPYGLSAAAQLKASGVSVLIFGKPMEFWTSLTELLLPCFSFVFVPKYLV